MAINFLNTVDFNKNQLNFARIQNLGTDPSGANSSIGQIYFNTTADTLKQYVADAGSGAAGWVFIKINRVLKIYCHVVSLSMLYRQMQPKMLELLLCCLCNYTHRLLQCFQYLLPLSKEIFLSCVLCSKL